MTFRSFICLSLYVVWGSGESQCLAVDAPKVKRLLPPGGQQGSVVECKLSGSSGTGRLMIVDLEDGLEFAFSEKQDAATVTIAAKAAPGVHWCRLYNEFGATTLLPFVVGLLPEVSEAEPNNQRLAANEIQLPATVNAVLQKSADVDTFAVPLQEGQILTAAVLAQRVLGSPMDAVLQVVDAQGTVVGHNDDDHGFDPRMTFVAPKDGKYYVRVFAFPSAPNSTIALAGGSDFVYRLTLTTGSVADYAMPYVVNSSMNTDVRLLGTNLPTEGTSVSVPRFQTMEYPLVSGIDIPLSIGRVDHISTTEDDILNRSLTPPFSITGLVEEAEQDDAYSVKGIKGTKLNVSVTARALHSLLDPVLSITDESGKLMEEADDRSKGDLDSELQIVMPDDGKCRICIRDRYEHGGSRFFYVLTCTEVVASVSAKISSDAIVVSPEKPAEVSVDVERTNGFREPLAFQMEGLPNGIGCETVVSEKEGDSAKKVLMKLTMSDDAIGFSGAVRIVGTSDDSSIVVVAEYALNNSAQTASDVWLTAIVSPVSDKDSTEASD